MKCDKADSVVNLMNFKKKFESFSDWYSWIPQNPASQIAILTSEVITRPLPPTQELLACAPPQEKRSAV